MLDCFFKNQVECLKCGCLMKKETATRRINIYVETHITLYGTRHPVGLKTENVHICKDHYQDADFFYEGKPVSVSESDKDLTFEVLG